jgi:hypothetical protein
MQSLQNFPGLGNAISGKDSDGTLRNDKFLGGLRWFESLDRDRIAMLPRGLDDGAWICAILLRNTRGSALLPGNLGALNVAGSGDSDLYTEVTGYATAAWMRTVVLIDPWLPAAGVPDDDLFWGIIKGPAPGRSPQLSATLLSRITAGQPVYSAADALGRITGPKATPANSTEAYQQAVSALGTAAETVLATDLSTQGMVYWNIPIFG